MDNNDSRLIELSCKEVLMNIVKESEVLDSKLSFFQKTILFDKIREMKYVDVLSLMFNEGKVMTAEQVRTFESKTKRAAKYGLAAGAGRKAGHIATKTGGLKVPFGPTLIKKPGLAKGSPVLGGKKGGFIGAAAAVAGLYLYRKLSDPCVRKHLGNKAAQNLCKAEAVKKVIARITADMAKCGTAKDPAKCKAKLNAELIKWKKKYQEYMVLATKARRQ